MGFNQYLPCFSLVYTVKTELQLSAGWRQLEEYHSFAWFVQNCEDASLWDNYAVLGTSHVSDYVYGMRCNCVLSKLSIIAHTSQNQQSLSTTKPGIRWKTKTDEHDKSWYKVRELVAFVCLHLLPCLGFLVVDRQRELVCSKPFIHWERYRPVALWRTHYLHSLSFRYPN